MRLAGVILIAGTLLGILPGTLHAAELFNGTPGSADFSIFPGWQRVMSEARGEITEGEKLEQSRCASDDGCALEKWIAFLDSTAHLPRAQQLEAVNKWGNDHPYVEDWAQWGLPDYWETPEEFITQGGDCEDYAILKYFSLVYLGFSPDDLRIVVLKDTNLDIYHAVLAVHREGAETLLLDNQIEQPVPRSLAPQYHPIYSLNERGWWMANPPQLTSRLELDKESVFASAGK